MNKVILAAGLAVVAASSQAALVIDQSLATLAGTESILFNQPGLTTYGPVVQGITETSGLLVDFYDAGENLKTPATGAPRVTGADGDFRRMTVSMNDPGLGITGYQFDIRTKHDSDVTIELYVDGDLAQSGMFKLEDGTANWFRVFSTAGETLSAVKFFSDCEMKDVRHNRIGAAPNPVPEPSAIVGLGIGLAMLLRRRFKK